MLSIVESCDGDTINCFKTAIEIILNMQSADARYLNNNEMIDEFSDRVDRLPIEYLAHEYLTTAWDPSYSIDVFNVFKNAD